MSEACEREKRGMIRNCALCEGTAGINNSMYRDCEQKHTVRSE